jgi:hypothetical protein
MGWTSARRLPDLLEGLGTRRRRLGPAWRAAAAAEEARGFPASFLAAKFNTDQTIV